MYVIELFIIIILGLVLGSFSTALIHRVPRKISWGAERSSCLSCKATLGVVDLIPVVSWCLFKGKCRHCSCQISCKYPIIELISVALCLGAYFIFGFSAETFFIIAAVPILISLFLIDIEHMILPNQLTFILFVIGAARLLYNAIYSERLFGNYFLDHVGGAFIFAFVTWMLGILFTKILKKDALGFGDVKFFGVAGLWLGAAMLSYFFIISGVLAILFALCWRIITKKEVFPFGPALIMALYLLLLFKGTFFA